MPSPQSPGVSVTEVPRPRGLRQWGFTPPRYGGHRSGVRMPAALGPLRRLWGHLPLLVPPWLPGGDCIPQAPPPSAHSRPLLSRVSLGGHLSLDSGPPTGNPGRSHVEKLSLTTSAKIPVPDGGHVHGSRVPHAPPPPNCPRELLPGSHRHSEKTQAPQLQAGVGSLLQGRETPCSGLGSLAALKLLTKHRPAEGPRKPMGSFHVVTGLL